MGLSNALDLVAAGSLARPGPVGRCLRLGLGLLCLYALWAVVRHADATTAYPLTTLDQRLLLVLMPLCFINYVVNIGFARNWGVRPVMAVLIVAAVAALLAWLVSGRLDSPILGLVLNLILAYSYGHLGISFVLAAWLATPGCEMRSIPELLARVAGKPIHEHACPVSFIGRFDDWERRWRAASPGHEA